MGADPVGRPRSENSLLHLATFVPHPLEVVQRIEKLQLLEYVDLFLLVLTSYYSLPSGYS